LDHQVLHHVKYEDMKAINKLIKSRREEYYVYIFRMSLQVSQRFHRRITRTARTTRKKYFDYFVFNIVDYNVNCGLPRSGARHRAIAQAIGIARGLDINSPRSAENHLRFRRHQQRDDPDNARGLDNNFASDRGCDSTTIHRLRHRRLRRAATAPHPIKAKFSSTKS
jgi:hypothetical protein